MKKQIQYALLIIIGFIMFQSLILVAITSVDTLWKTQTVDSSSITVGMYNSIALDSSNNPHISYNGDNGTLRLAERNGTNWNIQTIDPTGGGTNYNSLALDSSGKPYISYFSFSNYHLWLAEWNGSAWERQIIGPANHYEQGMFTSIAVDSNGNPHISYQDVSPGVRVYDSYGDYIGSFTLVAMKLADWNGSTWNMQQIDTTYRSPLNVNPPDLTYFISWGIDTSLALDSSNKPYISYDYTGYGNLQVFPTELRLAKWNGTVWNIQTVDSTQRSVGSHSSLALDSAGNPHISYCWNGALRLADWNGSTWNRQIVDSIGDVGGDTFLALDSNNNPDISYYANNTLKLAEWNGSAWNIQTIDLAGNGDTSLVLDSSGNPYISYYGGSGNGGLSYVSFESVPQQTPTVTPTLSPVPTAALTSSPTLLFQTAPPTTSASLTPAPTPVIPELPSTIIGIALLLAVTTVTLFYAKTKKRI